jgi:WD40 repeat protein
LFQGHKDPVVEFLWKNSLVVSGDRGGSMAIWDINTGQAIKTIKGAHTGAVSKIKFHSDGHDSNVILSTGMGDGCLAVHDMRSHTVISKQKVHGGAINMLDSSPSGFVVTGSADKSIKVFDVLNSYKPTSVLKTTDAVFCGQVIQNLILVGCGDGNILGFNSDDNQCLYGYGADQAGAVHCMAVDDHATCLVTGGDSGQGLIINFS